MSLLLFSSRDLNKTQRNLVVATSENAVASKKIKPEAHLQNQEVRNIGLSQNNGI